MQPRGQFDTGADAGRRAAPGRPRRLRVRFFAARALVAVLLAAFIALLALSLPTQAQGLPEVTIEADKTSAVLKGDDITYTLTRTDGPTTAALPVTVALTQTEDFLAASELTKTVTIAAGQSTQTFTFAATSFQDFAPGTTVEGGTLTAAVQAGTGYVPGTPDSVDVDHSSGADDWLRDGVLLHCGGSRHAGSEAGGADGRGGVGAGRGRGRHHLVLYGGAGPRGRRG